MLFLTNIDLNKNELQNAVIQCLAVAPTNGVLGQIYYNTTSKTLEQFNGTNWEKVGVEYSQTSSTGAVITGLGENGTVTPTNVINLTLTGYTPVSGGVVSTGDTIGEAISELDEAIKSAEIEIDSELSTTSTNPVQNKIVSSAINEKLNKSGGTMTGPIAMGNNRITGLPDANAAGQPVTYEQIPDTPVITGLSISRDDDSVTLTKNFLNIRTGSASSDSNIIELANGSHAGLMSPSDVTALANLGQRVEALEGTTVRLLYTAKTNPTAAEIQAFVQASGYTDRSKWSSIAVVVSETYHIWHYYTGSTGWRDDGVDTVSKFTNTTLGIIQGSNADGKVYAENDGTGSVVGWDALKTRVTNVENNKADKSDVQDALDELAGDISAKPDVDDVLPRPSSGIAVGKMFEVESYDSTTGALTLKAVDKPGLEYISGSADPTTSTVGKVGQLYLNTTTNTWFLCHDTSSGSFSWNMIYTYLCGVRDIIIGNTKTPLTYGQNVLIGHRVSSVGHYLTMVGGQSYADQGGTAIGSESCAKQMSVAIGCRAKATVNGAIQIGPGTNNEFGFSVGVQNGWYDSPVVYKLLDGLTGLIPFARMNDVRSTMDAVAVAGAQYYLGVQSAVSITMPTDAEVGQEIKVFFKSGATACNLVCDLTGFDYLPKANTAVLLTFRLVHKADAQVTGDVDEWTVQVEEG